MFQAFAAQATADPGSKQGGVGTALASGLNFGADSLGVGANTPYLAGPAEAAAPSRAWLGVAAVALVLVFALRALKG